MSSDSPINNNHPWPNQDSSNNYALSGRIMLASIVSLFVIVFFLVILHLYARWYLVRLQFRNRRNRRRNRSTRIIFYVDNNNDNNNNNTTTGGLDATVLKSLPVFVYSESDVDMPECAVCLSEFEPGETGRVLPKCKHGFHTGCIDMWFSSNSTCPLCRAPVEAIMETQLETTSTFQDNNNNINKTKQDDVGSSGDNRMKRVDVRIEVPNRTELTAGETELHMTSPSQGFRSPGGRLLSKIINMSRKSPAVSPGAGVGPSCVRVGTELDVESGTESSRPEGFR